MAVDTTALRGIADRLKRQTRNVDILALCDAVLGMAAERRPVVRETVKPVEGCPACQARREAKTASQRRWRAKQRD